MYHPRSPPHVWVNISSGTCLPGSPRQSVVKVLLLYQNCITAQHHRQLGGGRQRCCYYKPLTRGISNNAISNEWPWLILKVIQLFKLHQKWFFTKLHQLTGFWVIYCITQYRYPGDSRASCFKLLHIMHCSWHLHLHVSDTAIIHHTSSTAYSNNF